MCDRFSFCYWLFGWGSGIVNLMKKGKINYACTDCGAESVKWMGRCPACGAWGTMVEQVIAPASSQVWIKEGRISQPQAVSDIEMTEMARFSSGSQELDRVLGGGVIPGSIFLVGGDPGIGKSTLLLQTAHKVAESGRRVLYVTGEESPQQVKMRAARIGTLSDQLFVLAETDLGQLEQHVRALKPGFLVIDSIQTMFRPELPSAPGSPQQVRECTLLLLRLAKSEQLATCIVGHVTKDGSLAGPRLLEHMVDAVLYFEGDRHHRYRVLRTVKNRFGSTSELGVFDMQSIGLVDVLSPSELFLSERSSGASGSIVVASMEGSRPVLAEVQALVAEAAYGNPRRTASGIDYQRVTLLMAVLEKRLGMYLQNHDAYVNVAGGIRIEEPAIDLGLALSIASSFRDVPIAMGIVAVGEVGLTGEVRAVTRLDQRLQEAKKLGFTKMIAPFGNVERMQEQVSGIELIGVKTLDEAIRIVAGGK